MSQSNVIFGAVFVGFIVFITMRGKLPAYLEALLGTNAAPSSGAASSSSGASAPTTIFGFQNRFTQTYDAFRSIGGFFK